MMGLVVKENILQKTIDNIYPSLTLNFVNSSYWYFNIIIKMFLRFNTKPKAPMENNVVLTNRKYIKLVIIF